MAKKKKKQQEVTKPTFKYFWADTEVIEIMEKNKIFSNNIKNSFKCSSETGNPRTCVFWQKVSDDFEVGCKIALEGRIQGDVFLARKIIIYPKEFM